MFETALIDNATVRPSVFLINQINPHERVKAKGHRLVSSHAKLSVLNGCEGTESMFLIIAAILAFQTSWRHKVTGLVLGMMTIYLANQVRIVSLYFAARHDQALFAALHGYIAPTLIIAIGCAFYIGWIQWTPQNRPNTSSTTHTWL